MARKMRTTVDTKQQNQEKNVTLVFVTRVQNTSVVIQLPQTMFHRASDLLVVMPAPLLAEVEQPVQTTNRHVNLICATLQQKIAEVARTDKSVTNAPVQQVVVFLQTESQGQDLLNSLSTETVTLLTQL
jgi:hypothetical protein